MRSVVAFLACTGFIVWAHSCDTRIVGVRVPYHQPDNVVNAGTETPDFKSVESRPVFIAHMLNAVYVDTSRMRVRKDFSVSQDWKR